MSTEAVRSLPKMMIAFVVRRCTVDLGHAPTPAEFASWANNYSAAYGCSHLFGRPISEIDARVMLRHQGRLVTARSAAPDEEIFESDQCAVPMTTPHKIVSITEVRAQLTRPSNGRR